MGQLFSSAGIIEQAGTDNTLAPPATFPAQAEAEHGFTDRPEPVWELGVRLRALRSYFKTSNHPFNEVERSAILSRDFVNEILIVQASLLKCSELLAAHLRKNFPSVSGGAEPHETPRPSGFPISTPVLQGQRGLDAAHVLKDLSALCGALAGNGKVSLQAWTSFGNVAACQLELAGVRLFPGAKSSFSVSAAVPPELSAIAARVATESVASDLGTIFSRMFGLLDLLRHAEEALKSDDPLKLTLPFFTLLREESTGLLDLLGERALQSEGLDPSTHEHLDGTAYAVRMELRKAFEHELVGLAALRHAPQIFAKVENAHGLLRDCFQQSVIGVARAFDPGFDGAELFSTFRTKLDQSLLLRHDLWELLEAVRRAEGEGVQRASEPLRLSLASFSAGSLRYLMYKDWESYDRFADELATARSATELQPLLHRFRAFLETLFGQVSMRAVLAEHPFTPPEHTD